ncbi:methyltransferase [Thalassolituus sp. LLYu03]|uniref:methyltransferase n=1 Tax=Thalassolituus sp. LLYu03 TaxID=3421656 RepID=UPI003D29F7BD
MSGAVYELLQRHPHLLTPSTLIIGAEAELPGGFASQMKASGSRLLTWDQLTANSFRPLGDKVSLTVPQPADVAGAETVVLLWPKSKPLALNLIELIANQTTHCWVIGANDAGGKSIGKAVAALCDSAEKTDSARHCNLWHLSLKPATGFNWLKHARSFHFAGQDYLTLPGVFNHGSLDTGTSILLEHVPAPRHGRLLDLGCGSGVIGLSMKKEAPSLKVTLADIDAFALRSVQLNSTRLGLEAEIVSSDGLAGVTGRFDYIMTNPPFHQGKETNYSFARNLFAAARQHLTSDGQIWLIANRHLPYEDWAREYFADAQVMVQEQGFKLLCIQG